MSAAEIAAEPPVVPTNKVVRPLPFHCTTVQGVQLLPLIPKRKAGLPAVAFDGVSDAIAGTGRVLGAAKVKIILFDVVVELETVTAAVPGKAVSAIVRLATNCVPLTKVVGRGDPFQFTVSPFT